MWTAIFSHLCGQGRCLLVEGVPLPVCQRCLGLYIAAAVTGAYLIVSGAWRQGYPARRAIVVHSLMLMAAMLGGLHLIDFGPTWRLVCGLWTGHVAMIWLLGGARSLQMSVWPPDQPTEARDKHARPVGWLAPVLYGVAAWGFVSAQPGGWWIWTSLAAVGAGFLLLAILLAVSTVFAWLATASRTALSANHK